MNTIYLKFGIHLSNSFEDYESKGISFHRWLPNGESDAINLKTKSNDVELKIWFKRMGFVRNNGIEYKLNKEEFDDSIMVKQGKLFSGPLFGFITIKNIPDDVLKSIDKGSLGDKNYISLGKKIVLDYLYPPLNNFLNIIRFNYGQYWIKELKRWDSTEMSLGSYCDDIYLKWSTDKINWKPFIPDERVMKYNAFMSSEKTFMEFLTQDDWRKLGEYTNSHEVDSEVIFILTKSRKALENKDYRYAVIEGICALEMAISEYTRTKMRSIDNDAFDFFKDLNLDKRVKILMPLLNFPPKNVENVLKVIKLRNKVVHEGINSFNDDITDKLLILIETVSYFYPEYKFKFPSKNSGNIIKDEKLWDN
jgi:hypothetical protein